MAKYQELSDPPGIEHAEDVLGAVDPQSNDWADHLLLAALRADAVHYLVTNDDQMHRKARRLGVPSDRVLTIADARALLGTLVSSPQPPPPQVTTRALHSLRRADPIFRSLQDDYPGFDRWFGNVSQEGRQAWVIESPEGEYAGICIWKSEDDEFRLGGTTRDHFAYHRHFGPPAVDPSLDGGVYVIPIQPRYHGRLFPDHPREQARLLPDDDPFGNALRKAYLSGSPIAPLPRGATVLFYRSDDWQAITAAGVVEQSMRSGDAPDVAAFAGQRTVYSYEEIETMARRAVLAILFRQDRLLDSPWPLRDLRAASVLNAAPQSITQVHSEEGIQWLTSRLAASF